MDGYSSNRRCHVPSFHWLGGNCFFSSFSFSSSFFTDHTRYILPDPLGAFTATSTSFLVIPGSLDVNVTICLRSFPVAIRTRDALNVFVNASQTCVLHPPHVTPDITETYFVSPLTAVVKPTKATRVNNSFFISYYSKLVGDVHRATWIKASRHWPTRKLISPSPCWNSLRAPD